MFASKHVMTYTLSPKNIGVTHVVRCTQALLSKFQCKPCQFRGSLNFQNQHFAKPLSMIHGVPTCQTITIWDPKKFLSFWQFVSFPPPQKNGQKDRASCVIFLLEEACLDFEGQIAKSWIRCKLCNSKELLLLNSAGRPRETPWASPNARPLKRLGVARWKGYIGMCKRSMPCHSVESCYIHKLWRCITMINSDKVVSNVSSVYSQKVSSMNLFVNRACLRTCLMLPSGYACGLSLEFFKMLLHWPSIVCRSRWESEYKPCNK